jgi:hypothetical protein
MREPEAHDAKSKFINTPRQCLSGTERRRWVLIRELLPLLYLVEHSIRRKPSCHDLPHNHNAVWSRPPIFRRPISRIHISRSQAGDGMGMGMAWAFVVFDRGNTTNRRL